MTSGPMRDEPSESSGVSGAVDAKDAIDVIDGMPSAAPQRSAGRGEPDRLPALSPADGTLDPIGDARLTEPGSTAMGCLLAGVMAPAAVVILDQLAAWATGLHFATAIGAVTVGCLYGASRGRRRRERARRAAALTDGRNRWTVTPDALRLDLERFGAAPAGTPPDDPRWGGAHRRLVALRAACGAWLDGAEVVVPTAGVGTGRGAIARVVAEAEAVGAWLAAFARPDEAWLTAIALTAWSVPEVAAEALRRLHAAHPSALARRVTRRMIEGPLSVRWRAAAAVGDVEALAALCRGEAHGLDEVALRRVVAAWWDADPERARIAACAEPAVRWVLVAERAAVMPGPLLVELAGDPARAVRLEAFDRAEARDGGLALTAARALLGARGGAGGTHPVIRAHDSRLARAETGRAVDAPVHLRATRERGIERALARLADQGEATDLGLIAARVNDPEHGRAARRARARLRARFPDAVDRGDLALVDEPRGELSTVDGDGGLSMAPESTSGGRGGPGAL